MKILLTAFLLAAVAPLAHAESAVQNSTLVCESPEARVVLTKLSSVRIDLKAAPAPGYPASAQIALTRDVGGGTDGIQCGFPPSGRPGHHNDYCQESEYFTGHDHGEDFTFTLRRKIDTTGQPVGPYQFQFLGSEETRGDEGHAIQLQEYAGAFTCSVQGS